MWRILRRSLVLASLCGPLATPAPAQWGFDRPGGDYANAVVKSGDPAACATRCERDARCQSWSFSYPTATRPAVCWLKSQVPARVEHACCVSGVKGAALMEPRNDGLEFSIDRTGGDYRNFEVPADPHGKPCAEACQADNRCRAFTYVRPGYIGPVARCYLKSRITPPRRRPCCISGVVR
jgi:hypothetical protein